MASVAVALVWFLTPSALLIVALLVATRRLHRVRAHRRCDRRAGAVVDDAGGDAAARARWCRSLGRRWRWSSSSALIATAANVLMSDRVGAPTLADTAAAVLAPVYIGLPLGALVAIDLVAGREAVLVLMGTVAVSDTAQVLLGPAFGRRPLAPRRSPKKTIEGAVGGFVVAPAVLIAAGNAWLPGHRSAAAGACSACCSCWPASSATCSSRC